MPPALFAFLFLVRGPRSVPDEYKPLIFVDGVRKRFPPPTIRIQHPKKAGK